MAERSLAAVPSLSLSLSLQQILKHSRTEIRPLAFPVWVGERVCLAAVRVRYVLSHPREEDIAETFWYADVAEALQSHPGALLLDDAPSVAPRLR